MLAGSVHGGRMLLSKPAPTPLLPEKNEGKMAMLLSRNVKKRIGPCHREYPSRGAFLPTATISWKLWKSSMGVLLRFLILCWGRFHKGLELGAIHRDSSIHLRSPPTPYNHACKKLLKSWALCFAPCAQLYKINPRSTYFITSRFLKISLVLWKFDKCLKMS